MSCDLFACNNQWFFSKIVRNHTTPNVLFNFFYFNCSVLTTLKLLKSLWLASVRFTQCIVSMQVYTCQGIDSMYRQEKYRLFAAWAHFYLFCFCLFVFCLFLSNARWGVLILFSKVGSPGRGKGGERINLSSFYVYMCLLMGENENLSSARWHPFLYLDICSQYFKMLPLLLLLELKKKNHGWLQYHAPHKMPYILSCFNLLSDVILQRCLVSSQDVKLAAM